MMYKLEGLDFGADEKNKFEDNSNISYIYTNMDMMIDTSTIIYKMYIR